MKKFIYIFLGLLSLAITAFYFLPTNSTNIPRSSSEASRVAVFSALSPQFVSLRFENIGTREIPGVSTIPSQKLEECLKYLKDNNYHFLSVKEVYDFLQCKVPVPACSVWLSFDQGMESAWVEVTPLLKKYNARATLFIAVSWIRDNYRLTTNQLKKINKSGVWDVQTHGFTGGLSFPLNKKGSLGNFYLNRLWQIERVETPEEYKNRIRKDLKKASSYLQKNLNRESLLFCYPFNESLTEMTPALRTAFVSCLDELKMIGIGKNQSPTIYCDFSTNKHYLSRYGINEYADLETILSVNFTGKRITFIDKQGILQTFNYITPFQNNTYLCWNDKGAFAIANNNFTVSGSIFSPIKNQVKKFSFSKPSYLCTTLNNKIIIADNTKGLLLTLNAEKRLINKISINKKLQGLWSYNNKLYFLDNKGIFYEMRSSPVKVYDTRLNAKALWACSNADTAYVFDNDKKSIYKINYLNGKIIDTLTYSKDFSLIPQYALEPNKLVCRETERNVFLTVEIKP